MPRRIAIVCMLALSAAVALATAPALSVAKRGARAATPVIKSVSPMRLEVGAKLTIKGRHFKSKRARNTVVFRAPSGRSAFAKPTRASRTKLVLRVPAAVARLLSRDEGNPRPTRFKLRVLAGKFSAFTPRRLSPVVVAAGDGGGDGGGGGGTPAGCDSSADHDGDLLANDFELQIETDPCLSDTDLDGVEDGYEYQSALDLNHYPRTPPLPYPGKRPYPNALDSTDAATDYDDDGLTLREEYLVWVEFSADGVRRAGRPTTLVGLLYSDGLQKSIDPAPAAPADLLADWALDYDDDAELWDDERDADGDGLSNWDEQRGKFTAAWWAAMFDGSPLKKESQYPELTFLDVEDLPNRDALAKPDMDGDGVLDGADDHDHDGLSNQFEVRRPGDYESDAWTPFDVDGDGTIETGEFVTGANSWAYVNPFNPCKPFRSERCHRSYPFGYYDGDQLPPEGPSPPPGYPGTHPPTPNN